MKYTKVIIKSSSWDDWLNPFIGGATTDDVLSDIAEGKYLRALQRFTSFSSGKYTLLMFYNYLQRVACTHYRKPIPRAHWKEFRKIVIDLNIQILN